MQIANRSAASETVLYYPYYFCYSKCIRNSLYEYNRKNNVINQQYAFFKSKYINYNKYMTKNKECREILPVYYAKINILIYLRRELNDYKNKDQKILQKHLI